MLFSWTVGEQRVIMLDWVKVFYTIFVNRILRYSCSNNILRGIRVNDERFAKTWVCEDRGVSRLLLDFPECVIGFLSPLYGCPLMLVNLFANQLMVALFQPTNVRIGCSLTQAN